VHRQVYAERERLILEQEGLDRAALGDHTNELLSLHDSFHNFDLDKSGVLEYQEVMGALLESGMIPRAGEARRRVETLVSDAISEASGARLGGSRHEWNLNTPRFGIDFLAYLKLIYEVRKEYQSAHHFELKQRFIALDSDHNGCLSFAEAATMFKEQGLLPQTWQDQKEMQQLLEEADGDNSGEIDFDEFMMLNQRITETLRANERSREYQTGTTLGFDRNQMTELRASFNALDTDGSGTLSIKECRRVLVSLHNNMSSGELTKIFNIIDKDKSGAIDFCEFLYFMKSIQDPKFELQGFMEEKTDLAWCSYEGGLQKKAAPQ